jgi:hypothetical protein
MTSPLIQADSSNARKTARGGDISDATKPAERRLPSQSGAGGSFKSPGSYIALSFRMTGSDGINADLARRQSDRQSPSQRFDGAFRGCVQQGPATGFDPTIELRLMTLPRRRRNRLIASCTVRIDPRTLML